jgi:hypothetical protein
MSAGTPPDLNRVADMSTKNVSPADAWRLSALATTVSGALRRRFGPKKFYSPDEVEAACNECNVPSESREYAAAMFVEPERAQGFLQKLGSSKTAGELRKFMAQQIFFYSAPEASFDEGTIDFHQSGDVSGATSAYYDSGWDAGGFDGGGGGGDGGD